MRVSRRLRRAKIKSVSPRHFGYNLPHHPVGAFTDVGEVAVPRPDVEGLPADQLRSRPGARAAASWGRHRSCRHYEDCLLKGLLNVKKRATRIRKRACLCLYPTPLWLQQGVECGGGLPDVWSVFFSFPLTCVQSDHTAAVLSQAGARSRGCCCKTSTEAVTWLRSLFIYFTLKEKKLYFYSATERL